MEIFLRDIKQLFHIKAFVGTAENAVMIQIWAALSTILVLKALKATTKYGWHFLSVKINLQQWLYKPF